MGSRGEAALLQRQGQNLYGQGNWDGAISAFSEALKCRDVDVLSVLDNRAASYTKLLRYDLALKDARRMIKRDKQDERGYLRCAKALLLDGKPGKALEVYAYALKSMPKDDPRRQVVEQMHTKLQEKLVSRCYDPFGVFPLEIARMVVDYFDFRQIVAILRVSKGWDRFLSSMRDLFTRIDFTGARSKIHWSSVLAYIRRSKAMLTHAVVTNLTKASIHRSLEYISRCPNLQHLEILSPFSPDSIYDLFKGSKNLKTLLVSAQTTIPQATITKLLFALPNLQRIEIHSASKSRISDTNWPSSLPNLQSISLGTTESGVVDNHVPALYIPRLVDPSMPLPISNLTELRLHSNPQVFVPYPPSFNPADFPHLKRLDISGLYIGGDFGLPSTIEALPFVTANKSEETGQLHPQPLDLPNLTTLIFSDVPWVTHLTLHAFVTEAKVPLDILHVDSCFRITAASLFPILRAGSQLHTLNVAHIMGIEDSTVAVLVDGLRTLKVLNLSYTEVTGVTIKALVDTQTAEDKASVECVYVKGCERISSDAIEYGRSKGLVVVT
ncbi:hypothetical protein BDW71DRAFT_184799 [Aspergillus fruticulosus]